MSITRRFGIGDLLQEQRRSSNPLVPSVAVPFLNSVQHTLSLTLTSGVQSAAIFGQPPDHRLGWSGDGGPGRSTLHEFTFGAIS